MTEHTITTAEERQSVAEEILSLPDGRWTVKIWPWKQKKTSAQRRTNWQWNTDIAGQTGQTKKEVHEMLKERFLWKIFYRDDPGYARAVDSVIRVRKHDIHDAAYLRKYILDNTHAEDCDVDQMAEFLTDIKRFAHEEELYIRIPRDKEWEWISEISEEKAEAIKRYKAARAVRGRVGERRVDVPG